MTESREKVRGDQGPHKHHCPESPFKNVIVVEKSLPRIPHRKMSEDEFEADRHADPDRSHHPRLF